MSIDPPQPVRSHSPARTPADLDWIAFLARVIHRRYVPTNARFLTTAEDLKHAGVIGFLEARKKLDHRQPEAAQQAYLNLRVRYAMMDVLREAKLISLPSAQWRALMQLHTAAEQLTQQNQAATPTAVAKQLDWPISKVTQVQRLMPVLMPLASETDDDEHVPVIPATAGHPEQIVADTELRQHIAEAFRNCLTVLKPPQDRLVLLARYLTDSSQEEITLQAIADRLGCTVQRVHQREKSALAKMQRCLKDKGVDSDDIQDLTNDPLE